MAFEKIIDIPRLNRFKTKILNLVYQISHLNLDCEQHASLANNTGNKSYSWYKIAYILAISSICKFKIWFNHSFWSLSNFSIDCKFFKKIYWQAFEYMIKLNGCREKDNREHW